MIKKQSNEEKGNQMKKRIIFLIVLSFIFLSLLASEANGKQISLEDESLLMAVLWHQTSAEYAALAYQAYNIARLRLDEDLQIKREKKRAIIVDIDETALNNSFYNAKGILQEQKYPDEFYKWIDAAQAEPVPGALEFLTYASKKGCEIFYISNRRGRCIEGTMMNLKKFGFPFADEKHILLKKDRISKKERRQLVEEEYFIALLIGDNLIDFAEVFKGKTIEERFAEVDRLKNEFGKRFIILPNSMHGEWKKALYDYEWNLTKEQMMEKRIQRLKTW